MSKYLVIYYAPAEAMEMMANATEEEKAEGMKPWMAWAEKCGEHLVDMGTPLVGGQVLSPDGTSSASTREVTGYSMLEAESIDHAKSLLAGHPHLAWTGGCEIEVHECVPLQ